MKPVSIIVFCVLTNPLFLTAQVSDSLKYQSLSPDEFQKKFLVEENALLIDIREFFEFRRTRIKGAVNIPSSGNLEIAADTIDKDASLFLYCYSGTRSKKAARVFYDKGFRKLYSLDGGITLWKKERMTVDRKRIRRR